MVMDYKQKGCFFPFVFAHDIMDCAKSYNLNAKSANKGEFRKNSFSCHSPHLRYSR